MVKSSSFSFKAVSSSFLSCVQWLAIPPNPGRECSTAGQIKMMEAGEAADQEGQSHARAVLNQHQEPPLLSFSRPSCCFLARLRSEWRVLCISDKCLILPPSDASQLPLISALFPLLNASDDGEKLIFLQTVVASRQRHCFFNFVEAFIGLG